MKRSLFLAVASALMGIAALAGAGSSGARPAQALVAPEPSSSVPKLPADPRWTSYVDDTYGFAVEYPSEWRVAGRLNHQSRDPGIIRRRTIFSGMPSTGVSVDVFPNDAGTGLEEWFDRYQARYVLPGGPVQRGLLIGGEPAVYSVESGQGLLPPRHTVLLRHAGYVYRIEYQANDGGGYLGIYRAMLEAFSFPGEPETADILPDLVEPAPGEGPMIDDQNCCGYTDPYYNPYGCYDGNCVWWARYKRPDTGGQAYPYWGWAQDWTSRAAEEGFLVDGTPETGAIAGTPRSGYVRPGWEHHVAYVEYFNGSLASLSDMDYGDFDCHIDTWTMPSWAGVEFIHSQAEDCPQSGGVILYWNSHYSCDNAEGDLGYRQRAEPGWENVSGAFDDSASSLKVPAGWSVKLYADSDREGASVCRNADDVDFSWNYFDGGEVLLNDDVSSFEVFDASDCGSGLEYPVVLWEAFDYLGMDCTLLDEGWADSCAGFNDAASSIELLPGWSSRVYQDANREGASLCLAEDDPDFSDDTFEDGSPLDEQISSFEAYHNTSCTPPCGPPAPDLASPSNGAELYPEDEIVFSWIGEASAYQVHWWGGPGDDAYSEWISDTLTITGTRGESPEAYYWQVKGRDEPGCEGPWSTTWEYRVGPGAPTALTASTVSCSQIDLSWQDNSTTRSDFAVERSLVGDEWSEIAVLTGTAYQDTGLNGETTYHYRVRAHRQSDGTYSRYSDVAIATTFGGTPGMPSLLSPPDGHFRCAPTFDWSTVGGATEYDFQADDSIDFDSPEVDVTTPDSGYVPEPPLVPGTYYWRARARNSCGHGAWSAVWSVTVPGIPAAPSLLSPPDGSLLCYLTPTFDWSAVMWAASYRIEVDNEPSFASPVVRVDLIPSEYPRTTPLAPGFYYWRVRASGTCGQSEWSGVWGLALADGCEYLYLPSVSRSW